MNDFEKNDELNVPRFFSQWNGKEAPSRGQVFTKPTCTIPDQSMTIQEIIAKFTRTGLVPQSYAKRDEGGNTAFDPDFDPLDEGSDYMAEAREAAKAREEAPEEPIKAPAGSAEPASPAE